MKTLEELGNSLLEISKIADGNQKLREQISKHTYQMSVLDAKVDSFREYAENIDRSLTSDIEKLEKQSIQKANPFEFELGIDDSGYSDKSWESIIEQGQQVQEAYRDDSETKWSPQGRSPWGDGGYGSFEAPKIIIRCTQPVYYFRDTARLPGSFQVHSNAHMASILRFTGSGDYTLKDDNGWWHQTNAPVGIYVEPTTLVNGRKIHNFEQAIRGVTIVGQNGTMPVYISDNAFNFRIQECNIQAHQGSRIVIKHGPALNADWYPVEQQPSGNNYLPDPAFENCLIEGCHKFDRRNAGICVGGNNIRFHGLNFYGVLTGIMSTGQGRTVSACTMHHGGTHDGRTWARKDQFALGFLSRRETDNPDSLQERGSFPLRSVRKSTRAGETLGWYEQGQVYI